MREVKDDGETIICLIEKFHIDFGFYGIVLHL